jgi:hypothetical protein
MTNIGEQKYRIIFFGAIEEGRDQTEVKARLQELFKTTPDRIEKLFTGKSIVLNHHLNKQTADLYIAQLRSTGIICSMEPMPGGQSTTQNTAKKVSLPPRAASEPPYARLVPHLLAGGGMLVLFGLYIFLIFYLLNAIIAHLDDHSGWLSDLPVVIGPLAYFIPVIFGLLLAGALIKPFFRRSYAQSAIVPLSRKKDPAIYSFVEKICKALHLQIPSIIEVDCGTDIRAQYRRGMIGFLEDELTLTIGLGSLPELTISELGALIAVDMGHYTNTFDTRLFYCITELGAWLKRSAEDPDALDTKISLLRNTTGNIFVKFACSLAIGFVSIASFLLKLFLAVARFICKQSVRSFDFTADSRAISLVGPDIFRSSLTKQQIAAAASREAHTSMHVQRSPNDNTLPDNFPGFIQTIIRAKDTKDRTGLKKEFEKDGFQQPLPLDERLQQHAPSKKQPILQTDTPAAAVFSSFEEISKTSTRSMYKQVLHLQISQDDLVPVEDFLSRQNTGPDEATVNSDFF